MIARTHDDGLDSRLAPLTMMRVRFRSIRSHPADKQLVVLDRD